MIKQVAYIAILAYLLVSCHKRTTTTCANTVTMIDGSATYTDCGNSVFPFPNQNVVTNCVIVALQKTDTIAYTYDSAYNIAVVAAMNPFTLDIEHATASSGGVGVYTLHREDTNFNHVYEEFSGKTYTCSGGTINVTHADSSNVSGTYNVTVYNATETKTISGTFNANRPIVSY